MSEQDVWDFSANQFIFLKTTKYITHKMKCNIFALILLWIFTDEIPVTVAQVLTFKSYPAALQWWHTDVFTAQPCSYIDTLIQATLLGRPVELILNTKTISQSHGLNSLKACTCGQTCWHSNLASEWGRKGFYVTFNVAWLLVGWSEYFRHCWSRVYRQCAKRRKYPVSSREQADSFKIIERQQ